MNGERAQRIIAEYALLQALEAVELAKEALSRPRGRGNMVGLPLHSHVETDIPVLTDAKYPNAVLVDGSRKMAGDLDFDSLYRAINVLMIAMDPAGSIEMNGAAINGLGDVGCNSIQTTVVSAIAGASFTADSKSGTSGAFRMGTGANPFLALGVGATTSLPAAGITLRGEIRIVRGAAGTRDKLYCCLKSDANAYSWVLITDGGA